MDDLGIGADLVGRKVRNPARPDWGVGTVLRVQSTTVGGVRQHRVSVQFAAGHRVIQIPPGRLATPEPEPSRTAGWLDAAGGNTLDTRLCRLPESVSAFLGPPAERIRVLANLYVYTDEPSSLSRWARDQTHTADPLSHWSRDELLVAFARFCAERDAELRVLAAKLVQAEGPEALERALRAQPEPIRAALRAALRRPI